MNDVIAKSRRLEVEHLLPAYRRGIFPMGYAGTRVVTWHQPPIRGVLPLEDAHFSHSLQRTLKQRRYRISFNEAFDDVMAACARTPDECWITDDFRQAYGDLQRQGHAHSLEVWVEGQLAGGLYGVHVGGAFFAESKFHRVRDMSKVALAELVQHLRRQGFRLLDVQYQTEHLARFGVIALPFPEYSQLLNEAVSLDRKFLL
ncbi:MAG: leucyl/phenylalanyl-tRNA--protein transferase [Bryobacteraceae bacterium]|nr:leucyl/phenylalanyl-tRNA--protein transferase [Bryobacteraceae bacterium]